MGSGAYHGVIRQGELPDQAGIVTLSGGVTFCHVNMSSWGSPPTWGHVETRYHDNHSQVEGFSASSKETIRGHSTETLQKKQLESSPAILFV